MANGHSQIKIEGLDQLRRALRELPLKVQDKVLANSVRNGAKLIAEEAQNRAPLLAESHPYRVPGTIKRNIVSTRGKREADVGTAFVLVRKLTSRAISRFKKAAAKAGARWSGRANPNDPFYWRFVEFGTSKMAAHPFLRPAFDSRKEDAAKAIKDELAKGIDAEAKKLAWRLP